MNVVSDLLKRYPWIVQFVKFGLVGVSNLVVYYIVYRILLHFGCHYIVANGIGFVVSVLNSYLWNSIFVFKTSDGADRSGTATLVKTFIAYALTGLVLQSLLLHVLIDMLHISEKVAPLLTVCVTTPLNFLLNKFWTYREKDRR